MDIRVVPVQLNASADNLVLRCHGLIVGIWSVAPAVTSRNGLNVFTKAAWSVRSAENGMTIGTFTDFGVAQNFAQMLMRDYGDISQTLRNSFVYQETPEDKAILDEIDQRSNHPTRIRRGMKLAYIPLGRQ